MPRAPKNPPSTDAPGAKARPRRKRDVEVSAAAAKVFYERGYSGATVQDVADELGILKGSLYHYIKTKEDLLFGLFVGAHEDVGKIIEEVSAAEGVDELQRLALYVRMQVIHNLGDVQRMSIYYHELDRLGSERRGSVIAWRHVHERFLADLIEKAQTAGLARSSGDPGALANCIFATIIWPYRWYRPGAGSGPDAIADVCVAYVLSGVGAGTAS